MRRRTPGLLVKDDLIDAKITRAESLDPERIVRVLEPLVLERRRARLRAIIDRRLASVSVVFDAPYDPHNGAAVVRSCEAFGVQRLHVIERSVPFLAAASVARGAQKWIDVTGHGDAASAIAAVAEQKHVMVATQANGELEPEDLASIPNVAIVLGNERAGIADDILAACTKTVRVPMRGFVESLNVSVTAAILLHAATRGRPGDLGDADRLRLYARGLYFSVPRADDVLERA